MDKVIKGKIIDKLSKSIKSEPNQFNSDLTTPNSIKDYENRGFNKGIRKSIEVIEEIEQLEKAPDEK